MTISKKENQKSTSSLWYLEKQYGIPIWHNSLAIPHLRREHSPAEIELQRKLGFIIEKSSKDKDLSLIFISEKTDFLSLSQYLPFLFSKVKCYLCSSQLIHERLSYLDQPQSFSSDNKATRQLSYLLEHAINKGASDIHIESRSFNKSARMRIDGTLVSIKLNEQIEDALFLKTKLISKMDIAKKHSPQDGHFPYTSQTGKRFDLRTSTIPSVTGEKLVIRLLPASTVRYSLGDLGFTGKHTELLGKYISKKSGLILFTGPTGSGKTTSLYAILNELRSDALNIVTIEDPVEYRLDSVTQVQVNEQAGVSFSSALRSILRQDPDVILIGEIRDQETAQIAARAAQTGHLVLSTLHSNDVFETLRRLGNLGVEKDDISSSLNLVVSQRLVQHRCRCGGSDDCNLCQGTDVSGRIPIMEILEVSPEFRRLFSSEMSMADIRSKMMAEGFNTLVSQAKLLFNEGKIKESELNSIRFE